MLAWTCTSYSFATFFEDEVLCPSWRWILETTCWILHQPTEALKSPKWLAGSSKRMWTADTNSREHKLSAEIISHLFLQSSTAKIQPSTTMHWVAASVSCQCCWRFRSFLISTQADYIASWTRPMCIDGGTRGTPNRTTFFPSRPLVMVIWRPAVLKAYRYVQTGLNPMNTTRQELKFERS